MNTPSDAMPEFRVGSREIASAATSATRPLYWSVRRELWENRSLYIAPLVVAAVALFGYLIHSMLPPHPMPGAPSNDPARQHEAVMLPYSAVAGLVILTAFIVGVFYCLDALHGERRDRSILFWKSLPVSDRTTVLAKASVPLVVLPLLVFAVIVVTQAAMLLLSTAVLLVSGGSVAALWTRLPLFGMWLALLYSLVAIALWHAPIYAWLLLVSAWGRRATFVWAVLPPLALGVFERTAFGTSRFGSLLQYRVVGWLTQAFDGQGQGRLPLDPLEELAPGRFLSTPGLWIGLALAAACLAATIRLRRRREPI